MAEEEMIYRVRVYPQRDGLRADRMTGSRLGDDLFCIGMMSGVVQGLIRIGFKPLGVGTYHLSRSLPTGIYLDMILEGEIANQAQENELMRLHFLGELSRVSEEEKAAFPDFETFQGLYEKWRKTPKDDVERRLPIF